MNCAVTLFYQSALHAQPERQIIAKMVEIQLHLSDHQTTFALMLVQKTKTIFFLRTIIFNNFRFGEASLSTVRYMNLLLQY